MLACSTNAASLDESFSHYYNPGALFTASAQSYTLQSYLPVEITSWEGLAVIAILLVIAVASIIYQLSGVTGSSNARAWSKMQVYEGLVSLLLIGIFGTFSYLFFLNPQGAFQSANLLPNSCGPVNAPNVNNIYNLSTCDLSFFLLNATGYFEDLYYVGFIAGAATPGVILNFTPLNPVLGQSGVFVQLGDPSLLPSSMESLLTTADSGLLSFILLNQVQMILLSGSLLFLSFFMVLGLVARSFGFTRTFGGSMIAFGLGLGMVYPLLVSMSYGFIDVQLQQTSIASIGSSLASTIFSIVGSTVTNSPPALSTAVLETGYLLVGLLIIPLLNFAILDAFIVDFSKAIGERIDFMSMIGSVI
jgi:hypothetical protein